MIRRKILTVTLAGVIASGALGGSVVAYARNNEHPTNEAAIMANAKITMAQAIAAAEKQVGGQAVGTGIEDQDGTVYFEVQVVKDGAHRKVLVDPQSGNIVKTVTADNERNERGHESDDD